MKPWTWEPLSAEYAARPFFTVIRETEPPVRSLFIAPSLDFAPGSAGVCEHARLEVREYRFHVGDVLKAIAMQRREIGDEIEPATEEGMSALVAESLRQRSDAHERQHMLRFAFDFRPEVTADAVRESERQEHAKRRALLDRMAAYPATVEQAMALADLDRAEAETQAQRRSFVAVDHVTRTIYAHPMIESEFRRRQFERYIEEQAR